MAQTPTAVLFGLADVLVHLRLERGLRTLSAYARGNAQRPATPDRLFGSDRALAYQTGQLTPEQFLLGLAQGYGWPDVSYAQLASAWSDALDPWPEMAALAEDVVGKGHAAYLFASTDPLHFARARELLPVLKRFVALYPSFESHAPATTRVYFDRALERFGLSAAGCVFLDADPRSVDAAKSAGIPAFLVRDDPEAVRVFLRRWGVGV